MFEVASTHTNTHTFDKYLINFDNWGFKLTKPPVFHYFHWTKFTLFLIINLEKLIINYMNT